MWNLTMHKFLISWNRSLVCESPHPKPCCGCSRLRITVSVMASPLQRTVVILSRPYVPELVFLSHFDPERIQTFVSANRSAVSRCMDRNKLLLEARNAWSFISQIFNIIVKWVTHPSLFIHILRAVAIEVKFFPYECPTVIYLRRKIQYFHLPQPSFKWGTRLLSFERNRQYSILGHGTITADSKQRKLRWRSSCLGFLMQDTFGTFSLENMFSSRHLATQRDNFKPQFSQLECQHTHDGLDRTEPGLPQPRCSFPFFMKLLITA
jgi:hypothetical protein